MKLLTSLITLALAISIAACVAGGGGGSFHFPPAVVALGVNTFELELSPDNGAYSDVFIVYSLSGATEVKKPMPRVGTRDGRAIFSCGIDIPPTARGGTFTYEFTFVSGSAVNSRKEMPVKIASD